MAADEPAPTSELRFLTPAAPSTPPGTDLGGFDLATEAPGAPEQEEVAAPFEADADAASPAFEIEPEAPTNEDSAFGFADAGGPEAFDVSAFEEASMSASGADNAATEPDPWAMAAAPAEDRATESLGEMELEEPGEVGEPAAEPGRDARDTQSSGGDSLATLFSGAGVDQRDEAAAASLASVFAPQHNGTDASAESPAGRPTRAAATELSLDHVFRDPNRKAERPRTTGGFSFDQFFSESAGGTASSGPPPGAEDAAPDANADIEQFNAWLEGLKKK